MAYQAVAVANEFIRLAGSDFLSPMKLQKLVYYAHGWHLALQDAPLVRESVEAWQFGPVINDLYQEFKAYGEAGIRKPAKRSDYGGQSQYVPRVATNQDAASDRAMDVIRSVWAAYGGYSATKLSDATHKPGTPWRKIYKAGQYSTIIPNDLIKAYFKEL